MNQYQERDICGEWQWLLFLGIGKVRSAAHHLCKQLADKLKICIIEVVKFCQAECTCTHRYLQGCSSAVAWSLSYDEINLAPKIAWEWKDRL